MPDVAALRRTAYLLCGDWHRADELVQRTLSVAVARRRADPESLRAALVRCWDRTATDQPDAPELVCALQRMPARQRGCVVLRHWERCTVEETARLLGCTTAAVRRETAAALAILIRLRAT
jgi:DNA-directed RNA polymerase specialized sigma24 family protein